MTLRLLEILKSKLALRRRLTVLPIAEKLRLLDELRERSQTIAVSRGQRLTSAIPPTFVDAMRLSIHRKGATP